MNGLLELAESVLFQACRARAVFAPRGTEPGAPIRKVLVLRTDALGDVAAFAPVLAVLREALPGAEISVLTGTAVGRETVEALGLADRVLACDGPKAARATGRPLAFLAQRGLWKELAAARFDLTLNSTTDRAPWYQALAFATGARLRLGFADAGSATLFTHDLPFVHGLQETGQNLELLDLLSEATGDPWASHVRAHFRPGGWRWPLGYAELRRASALLAPLQGRGFVALSPFSKRPAKEWDFGRLAEAARGAAFGKDLAVVVVGAEAPGRRDAARAILEACDRPGLDLVGRTPVGLLAAVLAQAELYLGVDSGPMHLAALAGTPCVAIFGPGDEREWAPWAPARALRIVSGRAACPGCDIAAPPEAHRCLEAVGVEQVVAAARSLLAAAAKPVALRRSA